MYYNRKVSVKILEPKIISHVSDIRNKLYHVSGSGSSNLINFRGCRIADDLGKWQNVKAVPEVI